MYGLTCIGAIAHADTMPTCAPTVTCSSNQLSSCVPSTNTVFNKIAQHTYLPNHVQTFTLSGIGAYTNQGVYCAYVWVDKSKRSDPGYVGESYTVFMTNSDSPNIYYPDLYNGNTWYIKNNFTVCDPTGNCPITLSKPY